MKNNITHEPSFRRWWMVIQLTVFLHINAYEYTEKYLEMVLNNQEYLCGEEKSRGNCAQLWNHP